MVIRLGYAFVFFTFLASLIDSFVFLYPIQNYGQAWGIHLFLFVGVLIFQKLIPHHKNKDLPVYYFLFMPGLGGFFLAALFLSLILFEKNTVVLDEYEKYIYYENILEAPERFDYEREILTMSFQDYMSLSDEAGKKNLIIELAMNKYAMNVNVLQKGLQDRDSEVQHYSATTINMIENDYTNLIFKAREEYNLNKDIDALFKLRKVYKEYLESGLLSGEVFRLYNKEFSEVLIKILERKKATPDIINDLVMAYIEIGDIDKAEELNNTLLKYPERPEGVINCMRIAYFKGDYGNIAHYAEQLRNNHGLEKFPQVSFWMGAGDRDDSLLSS